MEMDFVTQRITLLRLKKNVSEYQMSRDLGHGRSYIQNIVSGHSNPSMPEFLYMCDYLGVTPKDFFDEGTDDPALVRRAYEGLKKLDERDLQMLAELIDRLNEGK